MIRFELFEGGAFVVTAGLDEVWIHDMCPVPWPIRFVWERAAVSYSSGPGLLLGYHFSIILCFWIRRCCSIHFWFSNFAVAHARDPAVVQSLSSSMYSLVSIRHYQAWILDHQVSLHFKKYTVEPWSRHALIVEIPTHVLWSMPSKLSTKRSEPDPLTACAYKTKWMCGGHVPPLLE